MTADAATTKILMIDDDLKLCRLVKDYLTAMNFTVETAHNGLTGLEKIKSEQFDAVILDVMLPGANGFEVLKQIRGFSVVPVLMLTALGDEADRIAGLEIGADDYLPKTFSTRELLARLRAVTRRSQLTRQTKQDEDKTFVVNDLQVDLAARKATQNDILIVLTALEFDLLAALIAAPNKVLSRDQLLDAVAGRDYEVFDRSIDVHVSSLRKKLGDDSKNPRYIRTVRSVGYSFVG